MPSALIRPGLPKRIEHVERHVEVSSELCVTAQESLPGDLMSLSLSLGDDPHSLLAHADRVELSTQLQFALDRLVETGCH
jgi:hypothetical protein